MLDVPPPFHNDSYSILWEEVEAAVKSPKKGKSAGVDNIPSELVQAGGEANTFDSIPDHHSPKERQPTTMHKLLYHQPDQSSK